MKKDTREALIDSAFNTFYKQGFQGANIATILSEVGINKGSMYHFFKSKKELGLAVIKERIEQNLVNKYTKILEEKESLKNLFDAMRSAPETLVFGCPLNKMSQEMLYVDNDFKKLLSETYVIFENLVGQIVQKEGLEDSSSKAKLIIATYEGALMIYHLNQNKVEFRATLSDLENQIA